MAPRHPRQSACRLPAPHHLLARLAVTACLLVARPCAFGDPAAKVERVSARWVVVSLPGLRLADLEDGTLPTLHALAQHGAVALMNTVTAAPFRAASIRTDPAASAYLTLGLARRAAAPPMPDPGRAACSLPAEYWRAVRALNGALRPGAISGKRIALIAAADAHGGAEGLLALTAPGTPLDAGSAGSGWLRGPTIPNAPRKAPRATACWCPFPTAS